MAKIGIRHPVFSPILSITQGDIPTYGTGIILGRMTKADEALNYAEGSLYADDVMAEYASLLTGGTITVGVDELTIAKRATLFGHSTSTVDEVTTLFAAADDKPKPGGFGFIKTLVIDGVKKYKARWYYKVVFRESQESTNTANDSITFTDTEIVGTILPVFNSDYGDAVYEDTIFDTEAAAKTYIDTMANLPQNASIRSIRPNNRTVVLDNGNSVTVTDKTDSANTTGSSDKTETTEETTATPNIIGGGTKSGK